jgi:hypothetical protein
LLKVPGIILYSLDALIVIPSWMVSIIELDYNGFIKIEIQESIVQNNKISIQ